MFLVDSHCHLDMLVEKEELDNVVQRASAANIQYMQTICTKLSALPNILQITEKFPNIFASVGVHPNEVEELSITSCLELVRFAQHPKIIGLGETGLDYYYQISAKNEQIKSFLAHILAAQETNLPLIVHTRDAEEDTTKILYEQIQNKPFSGLIHCFTASKEFAKTMLDIGFYISFSGIITFKNADYLREIVEFVPIERILVETDSPYLAPVPIRGKTNEPAYTRYVAEEIAKIKSISLEEVANITSDNFFKLFSKAEK